MIEISKRFSEIGIESIYRIISTGLPNPLEELGYHRGRIFDPVMRKID